MHFLCLLYSLHLSCLNNRYSLLSFTDIFYLALLESSFFNIHLSLCPTGCKTTSASKETCELTSFLDVSRHSFGTSLLLLRSLAEDDIRVGLLIIVLTLLSALLRSIDCRSCPHSDKKGSALNTSFFFILRIIITLHLDCTFISLLCLHFSTVSLETFTARNPHISVSAKPCMSQIASFGAAYFYWSFYKIFFFKRRFIVIMDGW
jgi:hypothetical protein